jgi:hypothetical protein
MTNTESDIIRKIRSYKIPEDISRAVSEFSDHSERNPEYAQEIRDLIDSLYRKHGLENLWKKRISKTIH